MPDVAFLLLCALTIHAQSFNVRELQTHLDLTAEQIAKIAEANAAHAKWTAATGKRLDKLREEIVSETAKAMLEPKALGVRYAEVEMIRRETASREAALIAQNGAVLNVPQKAKLAALRSSDILPAIAVSMRLMPPSTDAVFRFCDPLMAHPSDSCFRLP